MLSLVALAVPAQTLQQAESLWKQRKFGTDQQGNPGAKRRLPRPDREVSG
ncbi:MAG: hypothetical protein WDO73_15660 [Ignavibacteriota bacterium]